MVRLARRMTRAISPGVFCLVAFSTMAIILSMKLSPGSLVILTTMRSEMTLVPPVTPLRSPPDSRITGADSPVMADSSTLAIPSITSPSPGMIEPVSQITTSPERRSADLTSLRFPFLSRLVASTVLRIFRKESAFAFP